MFAGLPILSPLLPIPILSQPHICIPTMQSLIIPSTNFSLNTSQHRHCYCWCYCCCWCYFCRVPSYTSNSQLCVSSQKKLSFLKWRSRACAACALPRWLRPSASTWTKWPRLEGGPPLWPRIGDPAPSVRPLLERTIRQTKNIRRRPNFPPNTDRKEPKFGSFARITKDMIKYN